jgi:hypothetical protein
LVDWSLLATVPVVVVVSVFAPLSVLLLVLSVADCVVLAESESEPLAASEPLVLSCDLVVAALVSEAEGVVEAELLAIAGEDEVVEVVLGVLLATVADWSDEVLALGEVVLELLDEVGWVLLLPVVAREPLADVESDAVELLVLGLEDVEAVEFGAVEAVELGEVELA